MRNFIFYLSILCSFCIYAPAKAATNIHCTAKAQTHAVSSLNDTSRTLCNMTIDTASTVPPSCWNTSDGTVFMAVVLASPPVDFYLDGNGPFGPAIQNVTQGPHEIIAIDASGCRDTVYFDLPGPDTLSIQMDSTGVRCAGYSDGAATATPSGGNGPYQFFWDANTGSQTSATAAGLPAGQYCVTVEDNRGCQAEKCVQIDDPLPLLIDSITAPDLSCYGNTDGMAEVFHQGGTGAITYLWSDSNNQMDSIASNLAAGTYTVTLADERGCLAIDTVTLSQPINLILSVQVEDVPCFNEGTGSAEATVLGGISPYSYQWNTGEQTQGVDNLFMGSYTLTVTDANGCVETRTIVVGQPDEPLSATLMQSRLGCYGEQNNEVLISATGGTPNYLYQWNEGTMSGAQATGLPTGINFVTVTDANGCTFSDSIEVSEYDSIAITTAFVKPTCTGMNDGQLAVNAVEGGAGQANPNNYQYFWNTNPDTSQAFIDNLFGNTIYTVTVTDPEGCSNVDSILLRDRLQIQIVPSIQDVSCFGQQDGQLNIQSVGESPIVQYQWSANVETPAGETASNLSAGVYAITVTDSLGCQADTIIEVRQPLPLRHSFSTEKATCHNVQDAEATISTAGGTAPYQYTWSNNAIGNTNSDILSGTYWVTIEDAQGCQGIDSVVVPGPLPLAGELLLDEPRCAGSANGRLQVIPMGGTPPFRFQLNDGDFNGISTSVGLESGTYQVGIQDGNSCQWDTTVVLDGPPPLSVSAGVDLEINLGDSVLLDPEVLNAQGSYSLQWAYPEDSTFTCMDSLCYALMAQPQNSAFITVSVQDEAGCTAKDEIQLLVIKNRFVALPTGFSPNGDGRNDKLIVHGKEGTQVLWLEVYDRWGERLFERTDFEVNQTEGNWDGTYKGKIVSEGVYLWMMEVEFPDGFRRIAKGYTTVLK